MTKANTNVRVDSVITFSAIGAIFVRLFSMIEWIECVYIGIGINIILGILFIFSCVFLTAWAVKAQKKTNIVLGCLFLLLHRIFICIFGGFSEFGQVVSLCLSFVIFISMCLTEKRKKSFAALSFIVMAIITVCGLFPNVISIVSIGGDDIAVALSVFFSAVSYLSTATFYGALGIYIFIDGKPSEKRSCYKKRYARKTDADSLEEQLKCVEAMFEAGSITAEEYKERRKNILSRVA